MRIAIDPGKEGGLAVEYDDGRVDAWAMPLGEAALLENLRELAADSPPPAAAVELVGGYVRGRSAPGSAMFNFGRHFGFLLGSLMALGFRVELVRPQQWQKALGLVSGGRERRAWKAHLRDEAARRFPQVKVTLAVADALLILEWSRRRTLP